MQSLFLEYVSGFQWGDIMKGDGAGAFEQTINKAIKTGLLGTFINSGEMAAFIKTLASDDELRERLFELVSAGRQSCEDQALYLVNQMVFSWNAYSIRNGAYDDKPEQAVQLIKRALRNEVLSEEAALAVRVIEKRKGQTFREEIEVYLFLQTRLRREFDLGVANEDMKYPRAATSHDIDIDHSNNALKALDDGMSAALCNFELWHAWLQRRYPDEFAEASERIADFYSDTDAVLEGINQITAEFGLQGDADAERNASKALHRKICVEHYSDLTRRELGEVTSP